MVMSHWNLFVRHSLTDFQRTFCPLHLAMRAGLSLLEAGLHLVGNWAEPLTCSCHTPVKASIPQLEQIKMSLDFAK